MNASKRNHLIKVKTLNGTTRQTKTNEFRFHIWCALEFGNKKLNRTIMLAELKQFYLDLYKGGSLESINVKKLNDVIIGALSFFDLKDLIFIRKDNSRFTYGSVQILDPNKPEDCKVSLGVWQKLLPVVKKAVVHYGNRPVRCCDVINYANEFEPEKFSRRQIVHHMWLMYRTRKLKIVGRACSDGYGSVLFLPFELDSPENNYLAPLTYGDWVMTAFKQIWNERIEKRKKENCLIKPVLTCEVRERLEEFTDMPDFGRKVYNISSILKWQSQKLNPVVRGLAQSNRFNLWVLNDVADEDLDLKNSYSSNSMKIVKAVERAYFNAGELPVDISAIRKMIKNDENLKITGKLSLSMQLNALANRIRLSSNEKLKNYSFTEYIRAAGSVYGHPYFAPLICSIEKCREFIKLSKIKIDWRNFKLSESYQLIENSQITSIRLGRSKLLLQKISEFLENLSAIKSERFQTDFDRLYQEMDDEKNQLISILDNRAFSELPETVNEETFGLTPKETTEFLSPFYSVIAKLNNFENTKFSQVTSRIKHAFNRIPNPNYEKRTAREYKNSVKFLFEKTDLLIKTALRCGGSECRYQALIAQQELGILRDERFIIPALKSSNFEERQAAIACMAFLQKHSNELKKLAIQDPISGIRQAALWAYAFLNGEDFHSVARQISERDSDLAIRRFAEQIANSASEIEIWRF